MADLPPGASEPIALIAMTGRFPGADGVERLWSNLRHGIDSISRFRGLDLLAAGHEPEQVLHPRFVGAEGVLGDPGLFDARFFGYSPQQASVMDPQHRIALELAWEAFDLAGYDPTRLGCPAGVFLSTGLSAYLIRNLMAGDRDQRRARQQRDGLHLLIHNDKDSAATTISYKLGLTGPSLAVGSACSSSLVAVHLAGRSLLARECDVALAGGVFVQIPHGGGYVHTEDGIYSPAGRCAAFDAGADGTVGGSGAGLVLLKRLSDAQRDGDHIHALILGSAVNNDGADKVGYTAPGAAGQAEVIAAAQAAAKVVADDIGFIEAHGTGTPLGDPIEVEALTEAFRYGTDRRQFCALGSVKTNIGHLDAAAGVTGLIKAALAVRDGVIPANLHFRRPNPAIDFAKSPFYVPTKTVDWRAGRPRRAGVSSFGIGGTNAHVVVGQPPEPLQRARTMRADQVLVLSAGTAEETTMAARRLARRLRDEPELDLADVAASLAGRRAMSHRRAVVGRDLAELTTLLEQLSQPHQAVPGREVVFAFPGQGTAGLDPAAQLAMTEPVFRGHLEACAEVLTGLGFDLMATLSRSSAGGRGAAPPASQPAVFAAGYALARTLMDWGVRPTAVIGHSLGEYAAATIAGALPLTDALRLVVLRAELCQRLPSGRMIAVCLAERELEPLLSGGAELVAVNAVDRCVVAGSFPAVQALGNRLDARDIAWRPLPVGHAFHTAAVEPVLAPFREALETVRFSAPTQPWLSGHTGDWVSEDEVCCPDYWLEQLRQPVRFADGVGQALALGPVAVVEVGLPLGLDRLVRRHPDFGPDHRALGGLGPALTDSGPATNAVPMSLTPLVARLWETGCEVDWATVHHPQAPRRVPLPSERLDRQRYWVDPPPAPAPLPALLDVSADLRAVLSTDDRVATGIDDQPGLRAALDGFCSHLALWCLTRTGVDSSPGSHHLIADMERLVGVLPQFKRFFGFLLHLLDQDGLATLRGGEITFENPAAPVDRAEIESAAARIAGEYPRFAGLVELLVHCADGYPRAFAEPGEAIRVLYPNGDSGLLTRHLAERTAEHRAVGGLLRLVAELLERLAGQLRRPIRVLEVGAGEGGMTELLAGRLGAGRMVYHATDISAAFVSGLGPAAKQRGLDWVQARVFDITGDPARQGFAGHRYDLICGLDVVHATPSIANSLANLRSLLAPGGVLALVETTAADRWQSLIWGLADGWWNYADGRRHGPLLSADGWRAVLADQGFAETDVVVPTIGPMDAALVLAQEPGRAGRPGQQTAAQVVPDRTWPAKRLDLASWAYQPGWRHDVPVRQSTPPDVGSCLLFAGGELGRAVAERLAVVGIPVVAVVPGSGSVTRAAEQVLDPASSGQYRNIVQDLTARGLPVRLVVHLWAWEEALNRGAAADSESVAQAGLHGVHSLIEVAQALGEVDSRDQVRIVAVTAGAQDVLGSDLAHPEAATVAAAVKVIPREYPWISCTAADLDPATPIAETALQIVDELLGARESTMVAYRGSRRFTVQYTAHELREAPEFRADPDGVYLICGGLGGIGLSIAERLGRSPTRLVLTGRRPFPPEEAWESALSAGRDERISRVVRRLLRLRDAGTQIMVATADVTDLSRMRAVVALAERRFGPLTGVVHAAGVIDTAGMIQRRRRTDTDEAMAAKTRGALVLDEVVGDRQLDYFVLCSSIGTVLHKLKFGEVGYIAANEFLDAFAAYRSRRRPGLTTAVAWTDWLEDGMWAAAQQRLGRRYQVGGSAGGHVTDPGGDLLGAITRAEGMEVFARVVAQERGPRVVISTQDLDELLAIHAGFSTTEHLAAVSRLSVTPSNGHRPAGDPVEPSFASPAQRIVARCWSDILGVDDPAATDDFFELGGDSLLALRMLAKFRADLGVEVPVSQVFDHPTLAGLAEVLERVSTSFDRSGEAR